MKVISGKELAADLKSEMANRVVEYKKKYGRLPKLSVVLVGDDPASVSYVTGKSKACEEVGVINDTVKLPETTTQQELLDVIEQLNKDSSVDGILIQLPLPSHIDEQSVIKAIKQEKDVDGFHPLNVAGLWNNTPCVKPCTPKGVIKLIKSENIELKGKNVVVLGRSNIVGLPASKLLLNENATVTITHSKTENISQVCAGADILVVAIGKPKFVKPEFVKKGAVIVDVGVNKDPDTGKLCGDVDFDAVAASDKASYITKVPGGVGPMTIACLIENTIECYLNNVK